MYRGKKICVVVPAYNEARQLPRVLNSMPAHVDFVVIVDDCSADDTSEVARSHPRAKSGGVVVLRHQINQGVGGAIATGYEWARDMAVDIAVVMAGDGQMDPVDMPSLLDPLVDGLADYAKGNRLVTGEAFRRIPKIRFFGNSVLSLLTKIASGYWSIADSQTGYTAINLVALSRIDWQLMYKRYGQPNDLLVRLNVESLRVVDVPIEPVYNVGEKSGIRIRKVLATISFLLVRLFFWRLKEKYVIRNFHPLIFFYSMAFVAGTCALGFAIRVIYFYATRGAMPEISLLTAGFFLTTTLNTLGFAMWFDYEANRHLNPPLTTRVPRGRQPTANADSGAV